MKLSVPNVHLSLSLSAQATQLANAHPEPITLTATVLHLVLKELTKISLPENVSPATLLALLAPAREDITVLNVN